MASSIPSRQKPGGQVARTKPTETPRSSRLHKPDRMGLNPTGGTHNRGKGQK